jgi:hypothetical protein
LSQFCRCLSFQNEYYIEYARKHYHSHKSCSRRPR